MYDDYRKYLKDWFDWMKKTKPGFSHRAFSQWAGFKAPNQLLLIMTGERNIALSSIGKYTNVLKLGQIEKKYFELLVKFNQSKDMPSKAEYFQELSVYWLRRGDMLEAEQHKYLTNWYYAAVREMVNLRGFQENGRWISKRLGGLITPAQANKAIRILLELKLLSRNENGRLVQVSNYVTTGDEVQSITAFLFHEQMMKLALESLKEKPSSERNLTSLTFSLKRENYSAVIDGIIELKKRIITMLQNRKIQNEDDDVYQLNIHLFPIRKG